MDDKSLEMLEFHRIRETLAGFTSFSASRELALHLQPLSDYELISLLLRQSSEARHFLSMEPGFSIGEVVDIREDAKMAARSKVLEPQTLASVAQTLASTRQLRHNLSRLRNEFPLLWNIASNIDELHPLEKHINSCLAPNGEILDTASPS